ncbi:anti-sigma factor [Tumebacillus sp. ITR2]|uniref:Anti-sigma-W factor RsiW n=1 Tax=Tumebacillus amylolyticus TaxID=2801339 RepID=A0ABS1JFI4_9BACL|nr:anti-sigma factor [Tumebacillus amylolyticus]MBL0389050.1 anti-sigma factor [Tumebacillus amylolyticus]
MNPYTPTPCDDVELYALDGLDDAERSRFQEHLATCADCQARLAELQDVTDALLFVPDDVEPPQGMRERVLSAVTALPQADVQTKTHVEEKIVQMPAATRKSWQQRLFPYVSAVAVLAVAFLGWQNVTLHRQNAAQSQQIEQLGQLVATANLTPAEPFQGAGGQAMLLQEGAQKIVMIKTSNLPKPTDREQYTLWVMNHGKTQVLNGGTFVPTGSNGVGMVVFPVQMQDFDTVAISLEPDAYSGNTPRGVPVMTAQFNL